MDKFKPDNNMDESKKRAKFFEKIGSTIISGLFVALFWYYATKVEVNNKCFTENNGVNTPVDPANAPYSVD